MNLFQMHHKGSSMLSRLKKPRSPFLHSLHKTIFISASLLSMSAFSLATTVAGGGSNIAFSELPANFHSVIVSGPEGFYQVSESSTLNSEQSLLDGQYHYQIRATLAAVKNNYKDSLNNGRGASIQAANTGEQVVENGSFRLENGQVIDPNSQQSEQEKD
jgi:hypothetical protein